MDTQAKFLEGSLFRHIAVMSVTSSVGLMAVFAVDFVDMIFISMLGKAELAGAVGYAGAILFFTGSFGNAPGTIPGFPEVRSFLDFALAGAVLQGILIGGTSAGAAFALDIEGGFFDRLVASPVARTAIVQEQSPLRIDGERGDPVVERRQRPATLGGAGIEGLPPPVDEVVSHPPSPASVSAPSSASGTEIFSLASMEPQEPPGSVPPWKKLRSCSVRRVQAAPCTRAINGSGTIAPMIAEVPVTLVPTEPADFGDRHPLHTHRIEGVFHFLELEVANNGFNLFHG